MTASFSYSTQYLLDKNHFRECYAQSVIEDTSYQAYFKSAVLTLSGMLLVLFTEMNPYAAWFIFSLGILEALSVYYQKPWWVMRQMLSKAANGEVKLTINEQGISSQSFYAQLELEWTAVNALTTTDLGWLIGHAKGRNYISNSCLSQPCIDFLTTKSASIVRLTNT
jgi:hypothetical protein